MMTFSVLKKGSINTKFASFSDRIFVIDNENIKFRISLQKLTSKYIAQFDAYCWLEEGEEEPEICDARILKENLDGEIQNNCCAIREKSQQEEKHHINQYSLIIRSCIIIRKESKQIYI